ncbi:CRISPR-associated endonuclease Cas1 [Vibrio sp. WXL210]|uniref:CRISPR-associated endonuclease Cas1 n=1 Tax=Vibrio sp. WXL210 TaxID=3450709 RepID=UPI003EC8E36A
MNDIISPSPCVDTQALEMAFLKVKENKGAAGVDGVTIECFEQGKQRYLSQLKLELERDAWTPQAFKTYDIPKSNGQSRRIAVPTVRDRVVHTWLAQQITPKLDAIFLSSSFAYRKHRSYIDAIKRVEFLRDSGFQWVVDADIKQYFDSVSHRILFEKLSVTLGDSQLCQWIERAITLAQCDTQGQLAYGREIGKGIPQGSGLSPVLANLYLHELDHTMQMHKFALVRYADDFVVHCQTEQEAHSALAQVERVLAKLELELNPSKSGIRHFSDGFVFLGAQFIDQLTLASSEHTEQCYYQYPTQSLTEQDNEADITAQPELEHVHEPLSPHYQQLNALIEGDFESDDVKTEPIKQSLSQIAKLRTLYVQRQGSVLSLRGGQLIVSFRGEELQRFPASSLDTIWLFGNIHPTSAVTKHCLAHAIPLVYLSQSGQRQGMLSSLEVKNPLLLRAQVEEGNQPEIIIQRARFIVTQKLSHQLALLRRWNKQGLPTEDTVINGLIDARAHSGLCQDIAQLRGYEGMGARFYFQQWKAWLATQWRFEGRNRRPPNDPVNALLSYGYQLLFNNIQTLLELRGLSPLFGYLHTQATGFPSLALDMMEQWRPFVVDEVVLRMVLRQQFSPNDFTVASDGCVMSKPVRQSFIAAIEQRMQQSFTHPQLRIRTDLRRFMDIQIMELRELILHQQGALTPLRLR